MEQIVRGNIGKVTQEIGANFSKQVLTLEEQMKSLINENIKATIALLESQRDYIRQRQQSQRDYIEALMQDTGRYEKKTDKKVGRLLRFLTTMRPAMIKAVTGFKIPRMSLTK